MTGTRHGENAVILTVLTREAGLMRGLVPGGASARRAAMLQPGNRVSLRWRARLEDQLGTFSVEPGRARPGLIAGADALAGVNAVTALVAWALPERDPHPRLSDATEALLDQMDAGAPWGESYLRWEMRLLDELGFGLDLGRCAVTGSREGWPMSARVPAGRCRRRRLAIGRRACCRCRRCWAGAAMAGWRMRWR